MKVNPLEVFLTKAHKKVIIREAVVADAAAVMTCARHASEHFEDYNVETPAEFKDDINYWERVIARHADSDGDIFLIAEYEDRIVAICDFSSQRRTRLRHSGSFGINVHTDFHGNGLGRHMLGVLISWATDHPVIEIITLKVHADNARAIHLYKSLGFVQIGLLPRAVRYSDTKYVDALEMHLFVKATTL